MRRSLLVAALLLSITACREDFFDPTPGGTATGRPRAELFAENVTILPGPQGAIRIGFRPKDVSVQIRVARSDETGRIIACPLRAIDDAIPEQRACLPDLPNGVRESLTLQGLGAVVLVREGAALTLDIRMEYEESGRAITIRLPRIVRAAGASVCKDNGCNPFFEVRPVRGGAFTATARWTGGPGRLELLEGRVLARAFTSTGIPYRVAAEREGNPPLSISAQLQAPSEYALALLNTGPGDLTEIEIETAWP